MQCSRCGSENPPDSRFCRKCAAPLPSGEEGAVPATKTLTLPVSELERGTLFAGRYEIIEELGRGGMGRVYKALDRKIKEVVALKIIKPEISTDKNAVARFHNELKLARRISHRNVCRMYDLGEEGLSRFITMEYVEGENLKRFIKRSGGLTIGKAVSIARQVGEGLAEAHHLGIIHRDLKPQNIMIDAEGSTRILDFGISRFLEGEGMTTQGIMIGTPHYMSPEQAELGEVDERSDIYALGVILFEMVTGRLPFQGKTPLSVAMKHKGQPPPDPRDLNPQVPEGLSRVILKCLAKDKTRRYQNVEEFLADLENVEDGLPATDRMVPGTKPETSKEITVTFNRNRLWIPVGIVLALALVFVARRLVLQRESGAPSGGNTETVIPPAPLKVKGGEENVTPRDESLSLGSLIPPEIEKAIDPSKFRNEIQWLGRAFSMLAPEGLKTLDQRDLEGFDRFLEDLKDRLPEEGSYRSTIEEVRKKLREGKALQDAGREEEAQESYKESQSRMRALLESVRWKERADRAMESMEKAREYASRRLSTEKVNVLFLVADEQAKIAAESYAKGDFAGAGTLFGVLEKVFTYSVQVGDDSQGTEILKNYVAGLRTEVNIEGIPASASWFYDQAREEEERANLEIEKKNHREAAARYIQAAFLYEKVRQAVAEGRFSGRR